MTAPKQPGMVGTNIDYSLPKKELIAGLLASHLANPDYHGPDKVALRNVKLLSAEPGRVEWEMEVEPIHGNRGGNLHGGSSATILDILTTYALMTLAKKGYSDFGNVSRTITMSYLRPVPIGSKVKIECVVVTAGKTMANLRGEIKLDGKTCVTCIHDKVVFSSKL